MKELPKRYDTLCANGFEDATVWRVVEVIPPTIVGVVDTSLSESLQKVHYVDKSMFERATVAQLKHGGLI